VTRTGNQLLTQLSRYIGDLDFPEGLLTTAAGSSTTIVDTALGRFGDDYLIDWFARITANVAGNQYLARRISDFVGSSGTATLLPAFAGATGSATAYELHRISPHEKFSALDEARLSVFPALGTLVYDETLTADGRTRTFDIPSAVRRGPIDVFIEHPVATAESWNYLAAPEGDSVAAYTATSTTATVISFDDADLIVPKYGVASTKLVTAASQAATYNLEVAGVVNGITAALASDRHMTYARWVYCTETVKVRVGITDGTDSTYSSYHGGAGWELLVVEKTVAGANTTTLTAVVDIASTANASTIFVERGWWYIGAAERVQESWVPVVRTNVRRDDTTQKFTLMSAPPRGSQIRLVGRGLLSALGSTASTQATATMEVDEAEAELLVVEAAKVLFRRGIMSSDAMQALAVPLQLNERTLMELKADWAQQSPGPRMRTMWG
jgi:hypothetical protein